MNKLDTRVCLKCLFNPQSQSDDELKYSYLKFAKSEYEENEWVSDHSISYSSDIKREYLGKMIDPALEEVFKRSYSEVNLICQNQEEENINTLRLARWRHLKDSDNVPYIKTFGINLSFDEFSLISLHMLRAKKMQLEISIAYDANELASWCINGDDKTIKVPPIELMIYSYTIEFFR